MRTILLLLAAAAALLSTSAHAQDTATVRLQAQRMAEATVSGDYATLAELTYPGLVERMGGRAAMVAALEQQFAQWKAEGVGLVSATVDSLARLVPGRARTFALLPGTMVMKVPNGRMVATYYTIGISEDGGKSWTFLSSQAGQALEILFPDEEGLAARLAVPREDFRFVPDSAAAPPAP